MTALNLRQIDIDNFRFFVQYAGAAYCNSENGPGELIQCAANACPDVESNGAETVTSLFGDSSGIAGFVSVDHDAQVIVFSVRGSSNIRNWITNAQFLWADCDLTRECKLHTGFFNAWREMANGAIGAVRDSLDAHPDYAVVATGHSLGGAVAAIGAAYMRAEGIPVDVYTYGAPRAGNDYFANFATGQPGSDFRITHGSDPVSRLPPITLGYRHTTPEYWFNGGNSDFVDYGADDIDVCDGISSVRCNGGTFGLDITAHLYILSDVSACNPKGKPARRQGGMSDEEIEEMVNEWVQEDIDYVHDHSE